MPTKTDAASWPWAPSEAPPARERVARGLTWTAAAVLLFVAPFERIDSSFSLPGQRISNVEVVVLAALATWATAGLAARRLPGWRTPLLGPVLALACGVTLAAALAPAEPANAFRAAGRLLAGGLVGLLAADAARRGAGLAPLLRVAVVSGAVVGLAGVLEALDVPGVAAWLEQFRETTHAVGGQRRVTSTLQYPTITSMYLEIVFALALGLLAFDVRRGRRGAAAFWFGAAVLAAATVVLTLTRSGMATVGMSLVIVAAALAWRDGVDRSVRTLAALAVVVVLLGAGTLAARASWLRLTTDGQDGWYGASFSVPTALGLRTGATVQVPVGVRNDGAATWRSDADPSFRLSYHWMDADGQRVVIFDGLRTAFPAHVSPGSQVEVAAYVQAPPRPGRYQLAWDVVIEHHLWFGTEAPLSAFTTVEVRGDALGELPPPLAAMPLAEVRHGRLTLWRIALGMIADRPVTGFGPDSFRLLHGPWAGLPRADTRVHTNNTYLELAVGAGLAGVLPLAWLLWRVAGSMRVTWRRASREFRPLYLGVVAAVVAIFVHGLLDSFLTFTPTYVLIWMTLGLAAAGAGRLETEIDAHRV